MSTALMTPLQPLAQGDADLIARLARRETGSLEAIIDLYHARVARLAHRLMGWRGDAEDIVQDVFVQLIEKAPSFRGDASIWTWLTIITLNRCRTRHRRHKIWQKVVFRLFARSTGSPAADQQILHDETALQVRTAVAALPQRDREIIILHYFERKKPSEISELLGGTPNAIEVRLHRARSRLRQSLGELMKE